MIFVKSNSSNLARIVLILFSLLILTSIDISAQSIKKDKLTLVSVSASAGYTFPMGDLGDRFKNFGQLGPTFLIKFKNNLFLSAEGVVLFGQGYKGEDPLALILNENGTITNMYGDLAAVSRGMRGMQIQIKTGYIYSNFAHNPNSGITVAAGAGFFQSKFWIDQRGNNAPQVMGDYPKGYDKMSNGFAITQFLGYTYYHNKNFWNFYAGIEFTEAWTADRRDWDFALMRKNDRSYMDISTTIKAGWIITFIKREAEDIYYY
ncbi:MAG: hypothetical protein RBR35_10220 [Salinivirgaceae bacterium]|nr:hypothetical protein [Salinivirgaceae bacterium]